MTAYSPVFATLSYWESVHPFAVYDHVVWVTYAYVEVQTTIDTVLVVTVFNAYSVVVTVSYPPVSVSPSYFAAVT